MVSEVPLINFSIIVSLKKDGLKNISWSVNFKRLIKKRKEESGKESEETELKDICWANNEFKNEETRQSERPLGFSILSIRYDEMEVRNLIEGLSFKVKNA